MGSDPEHNLKFRRRWHDPPNRKRRPAGDRTALLEDQGNGNAQENTAPQPQRQEFLNALRRQRAVERLCRTPRLIFELLDELDRHYGLGADLDRRLQRYAALDPELLRALGADKFPGLPIRLIAGGRL
jgi:hypothetical protein